MYPVSSAFLAAVRKSHNVTVSAELWDSAQNVKIQNLVVIAGSVQIDNTRSIRRTCSFQVIDSTGALVPTSSSSNLVPFNREVKLYRGVQFADGTTESVPLGVFIVTAVAVADGPDGVKLAITGADRSLKVARAKWKDDSYYIAAGTAKETAIQGILLDRYPTVSFIPTATGQTLGPLYPTQGMTFGTDSTTYSDPWRTCMEIARSAGMDLYFDEVGVCRMRSIPDPDTAQVVATYTDTTDAVLLSVDRSLETDDTYNGVIATGEGSNLALGVRGEAWDDNAASPTYRKTYGEVPYFYSSPNLFTVSDCTVAAQAELRKRIGATEKITWGQVVNPAHDVYDVISMTRTPSGIVSANIVLDIIEVPLAPTDPMRATARARRFS